MYGCALAVVLRWLLRAVLLSFVWLWASCCGCRFGAAGGYLVRWLGLLPAGCRLLYCRAGLVVGCWGWVLCCSCCGAGAACRLSVLLLLAVGWGASSDVVCCCWVFGCCLPASGRGCGRLLLWLWCLLSGCAGAVVGASLRWGCGAVLLVLRCWLAVLLSCCAVLVLAVLLVLRLSLRCFGVCSLAVVLFFVLENRKRK